MIILLFFLFHCSTYKEFTQNLDVYETEILKYQVKTVWPIILSFLGNYKIKQADEVSGIIETDWIDYTLESNLIDVLDINNSFQLSKIRYSLKLTPEYALSGKEQTRVSLKILRLSKKNFIPGLKSEPSDGVLEKVFFYRIKRMIFLQSKFEVKAPIE